MTDSEHADVQRVARSAEADATLAGGRAVIYHRTTGSAVTLNEAGTILWNALETPQSPEELKAILKVRWPALDDTIASQDVQAFLKELRDNALLK